MKVSPLIRVAVVVVFLAFLAACVKQHAPMSEHADHDVRTIKTMITGIDQFDGGQVWGLNTSLGVFVVGPEVPGGVKSELHERLVEAHEKVVIIRYEDIPASKKVVAHKRVVGMVVDGEEFRLDY